MWTRAVSSRRPSIARPGPCTSSVPSVGAACYVSLHRSTWDEVLGGDLLRAGTMRAVIDTTTGDPRRATKAAARLAERNVTYSDACVSGSSAEMRAGRAVLLVGGDEAVVESARDVLEALSSVVFHLGGVGAGLAAKLASNLLLGLERLALAEALTFGEKAGIDPVTLLEVLRAGPAYCVPIDTKGPKMVSGDFQPQARLAQHRKDVGLILDLAREQGSSVPLSAVHREILDAAVAQGYGADDNSAVIRVLRDASGPS